MSKSFSVSPEVNLIGMTVDEAMPVMEKYLDDAYLAHMPNVRVVHGRGTGALKNAVHKRLRSSNTSKTSVWENSARATRSDHCHLQVTGARSGHTTTRGGLTHMAEKQRILIVDDDANIAELISLYLMKECYETDCGGW